MKELAEMYCKSKLNVAVEPFRLYFWTKSFPILQQFVESRILHKGGWSCKKGGERTLKDENGKVLMNCKYDKAKSRWALDFTNHAECIAFKKKFFKIVPEDDPGFLKFKECVNWYGTNAKLERYLNDSLQLEGKCSEGKFESPTLTICYEHEKNSKKPWRLTFKGVEKRKAMKEMFCHVRFLQFQGRKFLVHDVKGDGACFFRAVSYQIYGTEERHHEIRMAGIEYIRDNPSEFAGFGTESIEMYIREMSKTTTWCDDIIMNAVARAKNIAIRVIQPTSCELVLGQEGQNLREICVGYINEDHYISLSQVNH